MDNQDFESAVTSGVGVAEQTAGQALGDGGLQARGAADKAAGRIHGEAGKAQAAVGDIADKAATLVSKAGDQASAAVARLGDRASEVFDRASASAQKVGDTVEPFVKERPYAALAIAAGAGLVLGLLMAGRGPKVIYVRPAH